MWDQGSHAHLRRAALSALLAVAFCTSSAALSPAAPPPPTIAEIVENAQAVFIGRVESVKWTPIRLDTPGAGTISLKVKVTDLLLGDTRQIPTQVIYVVGQASMSEEQTKARYTGNSFVFAGMVNRPRGGETEIVIPPSGDPPFALSMIGEFMREITKLYGISGPQDSRPGVRSPPGAR
jgi:hypothetical protein